MATIASGTWDTPPKPRSKYKLFDTTVYELVTLYREQMSDFARLSVYSNDRIIDDWLKSEKGKYLENKIKEPKLRFSRDAKTLTHLCIIQAYITKEDLMLYKLTFGADACM